MNDLINRQQAIHAFDDAGFCSHDYIVGTLKDLPSAQPSLDEWCPDCKEYDSKRHCCPRLNRVIRTMLKDAQPERKKGHWIRHIRTGLGPKLNDTIECSVCRIAFSTENMFRRSFCPNCGAYMRSEDNG